MLFNSYVFIFWFLPVVLAGFFGFARFNHALAAGWLAAASLFFYAWWDPRFLPILLVSIAVNYGAGMLLAKHRERPCGRPLLIAAIALNLVALGYYKYANFFLKSVNGLIGTHLSFPEILLPLGISFFTFTQIAYLVDVYRGLARECDFVRYVLFVSYFPHLIAGPVLHHKQMMPQFGDPEIYLPRKDNFSVGLTVFTIGLVKKLFLADSFATLASPVFDAVHGGMEPTLLFAWTGMVAYALQLYFDFSGYSDMAVGLSRLFGVRLPLNFNSPYQAVNIIEFWQRWHMTLSAFLRDYLYIPLGGNRHGAPRRYINLLVTMVLGGLWHGASWTFVAWGGLHGFYLVINHGWRSLRARGGADLSQSSLPGRIAGRALTFIAVVIAWVFFRADSFSGALALLRGAFGFNGITLPPQFTNYLGHEFTARLVKLGINFSGAYPPAWDLDWKASAGLLLVGLGIVWLLPNTQEWLSRFRLGTESKTSAPAGRLASLLAWRPNFGLGVALGVAFALCLVSIKRTSEFLYFQF